MRIDMEVLRVAEMGEITGLSDGAIRTVFSRDTKGRFDAMDTPGGARKWSKK